MNQHGGCQLDKYWDSQDRFFTRTGANTELLPGTGSRIEPQCLQSILKIDVWKCVMCDGHALRKDSPRFGCSWGAFATQISNCSAGITDSAERRAMSLWERL